MEIEEKVLKEIENGEVKMRPRAYFTIRKAMDALLGLIVLLLVVYLVSFLVFALRESGVWYEPAFGGAGWAAFFFSLPWALIALIAIFFVALAIMMSRSSVGYRWPIVYSLVGAICLIGAANLLIINTSINNAIFGGGVHEEIPIVGRYYSGFEVPAEGDIHHGEVLAPLSAGNGFVLMDLYGATSAVVVASATSFLPAGVATETITPGEEVVVFGERNQSGTIDALGVDEISPCPGCSNK